MGLLLRRYEFIIISSIVAISVNIYRIKITSRNYSFNPNSKDRDYSIVYLIEMYLLKFIIENVGEKIIE